MLIVSELKQQLLNLYSEIKNLNIPEGLNENEKILYYEDYYAGRLADIITNYIKTATVSVVVSAGQSVQVNTDTGYGNTVSNGVGEGEIT